MSEFPRSLSGRWVAGAFIGCIAGMLLLFVGALRVLIFLPANGFPLTLEAAGVAAMVILGCTLVGMVVGVMSPLARGTVLGWIGISCVVAIGLLLILYVTGLWKAPSSQIVVADVVAAVLLGTTAAVSGVYYWRRS